MLELFLENEKITPMSFNQILYSLGTQDHPKFLANDFCTTQQEVTGAVLL